MRRRRDQRVDERREHRAHDRGPLGIAQTRSACDATSAAASPRPSAPGRSTCCPMTRSRVSGDVRSGMGSGRHGSSPASASRIAATRPCSRSRTVGVRRRRARANARRAEVRRCKSGDHVEHARELEHGERVRVHPQISSDRASIGSRQAGRGVRAASSSRTMALIVPPSARPLNWGITFPITAPTFDAPPSIAATTAARISSSLTPAGR